MSTRHLYDSNLTKAFQDRWRRARVGRFELADGAVDEGSAQDQRRRKVDRLELQRVTSHSVYSTHANLTAVAVL